MLACGLVARLKCLETGAHFELWKDTVVGRSSSCSLVLKHAFVSSLHAQIGWSLDSWTVRDLSRNGTAVNGKALERDERRRLLVGDALSFGGEAATWEVVDLSAPRPLLIPLAGGEAIDLHDSPIALPSANAPDVTVYVDADGFVILESPRAREALEDGQVIETAGLRWKVQLPNPLAPTQSAGQRIRDARIRLRASAHEEHVEGELILNGTEYALPSRAHLYLLLVLAREYAADRDRGLAEPERGWIVLEDLLERLKLDRITINTQVYRLRKQLAQLGVSDAADVIERRRGSDEVRIGCPNVSISG